MEDLSPTTPPPSTQTPSIDPTEPDPAPEFVFDRSLPDEFDEFED